MQVASASQNLAEAGGPQADVSIAAVAATTEEKYAGIRSYVSSGITSRYQRDFDGDEAASAELFIEFKRFLAVSAACANHGTTAGMAGPVDDMWHTALLFTREYSALCERLGCFIHHLPDVSEEDHLFSLAGYVRFVQIYTLAFGVKPPAHVWPELNEDGTGVAAACAGCGAGGPGSCSSCSGCQGQNFGITN